jgi:hypothetical protein
MPRQKLNLKHFSVFLADMYDQVLYGWTLVALNKYIIYVQIFCGLFYYVKVHFKHPEIILPNSSTMPHLHQSCHFSTSRHHKADSAKMILGMRFYIGVILSCGGDEPKICEIQPKHFTHLNNYVFIQS